jgi:hypothetical protein
MNKPCKLCLLLFVGLATRTLFGSQVASSEVVVSVVDQRLAFVAGGRRDARENYTAPAQRIDCSATAEPSCTKRLIKPDS